MSFNLTMCLEAVRSEFPAPEIENRMISFSPTCESRAISICHALDEKMKRAEDTLNTANKKFFNSSNEPAHYDESNVTMRPSRYTRP